MSSSTNQPSDDPPIDPPTSPTEEPISDDDYDSIASPSTGTWGSFRARSESPEDELGYEADEDEIVARGGYTYRLAAGGLWYGEDGMRRTDWEVRRRNAARRWRGVMRVWLRTREELRRREVMRARLRRFRREGELRRWEVMRAWLRRRRWLIWGTVLVAWFLRNFRPTRRRRNGGAGGPGGPGACRREARM
ncbi:hypothetical protein EG328_008671 [Venturia inaequalis]|uniref:Uncharacterized protein n=1 Tax=Venturia inaequalis TaxID=5025 RepID=A0A8H3VKS6_VENIN|nr:hypothetical protein EG328_008671 [Venturia inaequalis]RDI83028.1 hypothetical protein Vi05172_g6914 [Venturia inaequalis]